MNEWIYSEPTFRMAKQTESVKDRNGNLITLRLCEEFIEGRWEPFYSIVR